MSDLGADAEQLRRIEAVTDAALAHLELEELLDELLQRVRELLHADTATVLLLDEATGELVATAAKGLEEEVRQGVRVPMGQGFAGRVAAHGVPMAIERVDASTVVNPLLYEVGLHALLGTPLVASGRTIGVLHVGSLAPRHFVDEDVQLLQVVADRVALATDARRANVDRAAAAALQRSLLPARLPEVPGLELAARYLPGEEGGVGGDWYDVFPLPDGLVGVVMGDVVGRGLGAAVVMGRMRSALRAYAIEDDDPARVLTRLDRKAQHFEAGQMTTVLYGVVDPARRTLALSSAGHLLPLVIGPGRAPAQPEVPVDPPLSVVSGADRRSVAVDLDPGAVVCLFTDGLVERRRASIDAGLSRLRAALDPAPPTADAACRAAMAATLQDEHPDDVAVLALRLLPGE